MQLNFRRSRIILVVLVSVISGCANNARAPITNKSTAQREAAVIHRDGQRGFGTAQRRPSSYIVRRGDTLHSIAWRFGLDYRELSRWNRIPNPDVIHVGQHLRLHPGGRVKSQPTKSTRSTAPSRTRKPTKAAPTRSPSKSTIAWNWPAKGEVRTAASAAGAKGIEILGSRGQPVIAAAGGEVVYSGSGLRGYGRLIIVKHSEEYLSAYAHNERLLVNEGATVKPRQRIADMGDSDAKSVMLHFEIRRNGKAVKPRNYLPRR